MGPTGTPTETPGGETVLLIGGGLGNAVLFSIGQALRAHGSRVLYFAGYKRVQDRYKVAEIEKAADTVIWCCDEAPGCSRPRAGHGSFVGNIVQAIDTYGAGQLGDPAIPLGTIDRIVAIGSDGMMAAVQRARHGILRPVSEARSPGHRLDQLADAVHDEGDLRAVPAAPQGPGDRGGDRCLLLLQPGSGPRPGRFRQSPRAALPERRAGEADEIVDRPVPAADRPPGGSRGVGGRASPARQRLRRAFDVFAGDQGDDQLALSVQTEIRVRHAVRLQDEQLSTQRVVFGIAACGIRDDALFGGRHLTLYERDQSFRDADLAQFGADFREGHVLGFLHA